MTIEEVIDQVTYARRFIDADTGYSPEVLVEQLEQVDMILGEIVFHRDFLLDATNDINRALGVLTRGDDTDSLNT